jgi:very-short-patch-repair endonuclease
MVAAEQHGCLTAGQAMRCGLSAEAVRRRVRDGRWRRVLPKTYVLRAAPSTWEQRLFAALLWAGETAAASGLSAAALWGFPDFSPGPVEISHSGARQSRGQVLVRRVRLEPTDVTRIRGIPVTTPARTLADLAGRVDGARLDAALHYCLHDRLTTAAALQDLSERRSGPGFPGAGRLRASLAAYAGGPAAASPLEVRLDRRLRASGFPSPRRQHEVMVDGHRYYLDFAWPAARLAVEVDGYRWHSSRTAWLRDRQRLAALRRKGWTVVRVTREDVDDRFGDLEKELREFLQ